MDGQDSAKIAVELRSGAMSDIYEFQVKGLLDKRWSEWFGGLTIRHQEDGTTVLVGPVVDQAALHGVMVRIRDLGLLLLSVKRAA